MLLSHKLISLESTSMLA